MSILSILLSIVIISYDPAPGQFINVLPAVTTDAAAAAQTSLDRGSLVCLGALGGSITARFEAPVVNNHTYEIAVFGNAFNGSSEPGVIFVSQDVNHNGIADDPWYEIAGSEYSRTDHQFTITYYRPANDSSDIAFRDSQGNTGYIYRNSYHSQPYYPTWVTADSIVCHGALLPCNVDTTGTYNRCIAYDYGYCDNKPNEDTIGCSIQIDWAVDSFGNPANLPSVDFIRVQTGVMYSASTVTGELSTELSGIMVLEHLPSAVDHVADNVTPVMTTDEILFPNPLSAPAALYSMSGKLITTIPAGTQSFSLQSLPLHSVYILRTATTAYRFVR